MAPNTAAPTDWPRMAINIVDEVAMPRWFQPTLAWVETMNAVLQKPMPTPSMKAPLPAQSSPLAGVSKINRRLPATRKRRPIDADRRYEVRIIRRPAAMLANAQLTEDAASTTPAAVAPRHMAPCTDVADDRRGDRLNGPRADPLNRPEQDQRTHVPGAAAQQGAEQKHTCAGKEHPLAAVEVGEAPIDRDRHCLGQQECGKCPAEQAKPAEVGDD